jgi:anaerobic selenocysteine-containing dehydrogenase
VRRYLLEGGTKSQIDQRLGSPGSKPNGTPPSTSPPINCASPRHHGADTIGVLASAKCLNEENYLMNKFARQVIGTNNIDHCARL